MEIILIIISGLLHILLIVLILIFFFHFVIQKITYSTIYAAICIPIGNNLNSITRSSPIINDDLNKYMSNDQLIKLAADFNEQTDVTIAHNKKIYFNIIILISVLLATIFILIITSGCYASAELYKLLIEIFITFILVGCAEVSFFLLVTKKYITITDSKIYQIISESLPAS